MRSDHQLHMPEGEVSRTKQSMQQECDINFIVGQFMKTGAFAHVAIRPPTYGDFTTVDDYLTARTQIAEADQAFAALPASIRDSMDNDPAVLLEFLQDPDNLEEARELGLVGPAPETPPVGPPAIATPEGNPPIPENPSPVEGGE